MKRFICILLLIFILPGALCLRAAAQELLIPVGSLIGLQLHDNTVTIAAFDDILGASARKAGLEIGDELVAIQGQDVDRIQDVSRILDGDTGPITLTVCRGSKCRTVHMTPTATPGGPKLGVYLRQGISGIGTVTWYDPHTGRFGTLGHGISDRRGILSPMQEGFVYPAAISQVIPGRSGHPGFLKGTADAAQCMGTLLRNTPQGVFGKAPEGWRGEPLPVADFSQIHPGPAAIRSTVTGTEPKEYSVEILKIYPPDRPDSRNFLLKITDPTLLHTTGGIVQGMSGSPILQDGRIIGAVTHVMVSDPTTGYGIFIGNMLDAAA